jgi:hypothetical protein
MLHHPTLMFTPVMYILYFPAHKAHHDFFVRNSRKRKNNDECILILVINWKKTGLLHTKISNRNITLVNTQNVMETRLAKLY